jgi:hypothetical protein
MKALDAEEQQTEQELKDLEKSLASSDGGNSDTTAALDSMEAKTKVC